MAFTLRNVGGSKFGGGALTVRQSRSQEGSDCNTTVYGVWGSEGKVYISTNEGKQIIVTDSVPRSRWAESYALIIDNASSHIIAVFQNPSCSSQVYVIYSNSITDCMEHNRATNQWTKKHSFQLSNAKGVEILCVSLHPHTSMFFWCERRGSSLGLASCCVCMREVPESWDMDFLSCIGPVVAILHSCPMMSLWVINKGVCMLPHLPDEHKQLLFFWTFVPRSLKVYVWNHATIGNLDKTDFKSIIMHLLPAWNSYSSPESEYIISLTAHPTTLELLILDNSYVVSYASIHDGELCIQRLSKLYSLPGLGKDQTIKNIFAVGLFVGLVWESGLMDVFDSRSGVALCTITELEDLKLTIWAYTGCVPGIGVWAAGGIWELKSKSISDVAEVMQNSMKLNSDYLQNEKTCTDFEENSEQNNVVAEAKEPYPGNITCPKCLPGYKPHPIDPMSVCSNVNITFSGPVAATHFLHSWNMSPLAAKVALSSVVLKIIGNDSVNYEGVVEKELLGILLSNSFQSPVAALTLLYSHPWYKDKVLMALKNFLQNFENKPEESDEKVIKTALNHSLYPYMKQFLSLSEKFEVIAKHNLVCDHTEITEILHKLNLANPDSQSLSRLSYLQSGSSREVFESVAQLMGLGSYEDNMATQDIKIHSQRWREIFRMEWKDGRWQKKRVAMESPNNPSLSLLCNLLYNEEPDWLLKVHDNGMAVVNAKDADECAKDHVTQSILDCLPALIVDPSAKSTHAHAILLWTAGQEMQSMQVILRHQMWSQALDFFSSLPEDTNTLVVLFIMMFKAFLCYCAPKEVLLKALSLAPQGFSTYELLFILQDNGPKCNEPFVHDVLTVGDVRQQLQEILKQ